MEITPQGQNPASVTPAGSSFDLSAVTLAEAMKLGYTPEAWAKAVRDWVDSEPYAEDWEKANVHDHVATALAQVAPVRVV